MIDQHSLLYGITWKVYRRFVSMASHMLHWADYLILVGFLVISLSIGIYHSLTGGRQKTTAEFIMANRKLKVIPTAISLLVSLYSGVSLLGQTAEIYSYGVQFIVFTTIASVVSHLLIERIIVPWLYPLKLVSIYDYLEMRFMSKIVRIFGAAVGILVGVLSTGAVIYAPSAALESATGFPLAASVPLMTIFSVAYTVLGGMRAVIWTDVFQFFIMTGGLIAILVKGLIVVGGISSVFRLAGEEGRLVWANTSLDPQERHTVWNTTIGAVINMIAICGLSQVAVQRFSAVNKLSKARTMILLNIPGLVIMFAITGVIGLIIVAYYAIIKCDPLANKDIASPNMLLSYLVVTIFADSPGFSGLFLSTLYGASLSTVSSMLSGAAANCWEDIFKWKLDHLPETRKVLINRLFVILFGVIATGVAFLAASVDSPILQVLIAIRSSLVGPMTAIFVLGAVSKHANWKGTLLGGIVGISLSFWLTLGSMTLRRRHFPPLHPVSMEKCSSGNENLTLFYSSMDHTNYTSVFDGKNWNETSEALLKAPNHVIQLRGLDNLYSISYMWVSTIAFVVTGVVGIIASFIMRDRDLESKVEKRFLLRIHFFSCSDEKENQEHLDEQNETSPQKDKDVKEQEDGFLKEVVKTDSSQETENRFSNEMKDDAEKETRNSLLDASDSPEETARRV